MKTPIALAIVLLLATVPAAADYEVPRTSYGVPDLEGVWTNATITNLERPDRVDSLVLTPEQAAAWEGSMATRFEQSRQPTDPDAPAPEAGRRVGGYNTFWMDPGTKLLRVGGEIRSSIIVDPADGKLPFSEEGRQRLEQAYAYTRGVKGPEQRPLGERCIVGFGSTGGPPMLPVLYNNHYQFVQTPGHLVILVEMNHDARIVRMDAEHLPDDVRPWLGDSVGHWDGDTLVVETTNFNPGQSLRLAIRHQVYMSKDARVIERFTRVADDAILYEFTVEDPEVMTQPWRGEMTLRAMDAMLYEYACHEGNYSLPGILAGARAEEKQSVKTEGGE